MNKKDIINYLIGDNPNYFLDKPTNMGSLFKLHKDKLSSTENTSILNDILNILKDTVAYKKVCKSSSSDLALFCSIVNLFFENDISLHRAILAMIRPPINGWLPLMLKIKDYTLFSPDIIKLINVAEVEDNLLQKYLDQLRKEWKEIHSFYAESPLYSLAKIKGRPSNKDMLPEFHNILRKAFTGYVNVSEVPCVTTQDLQYNVWHFGAEQPTITFYEEPYYRNVLANLSYIWLPNKELSNLINIIGKSVDEDLTMNLEKIYEQGLKHLKPYGCHKVNHADFFDDWRD